MSNYPRTKHCEWRARGFLTLKFLMVNMILLCIIFCDMGFQNFFQKELGTRYFLKTNTDLSGKNNYFIFDLLWNSDFPQKKLIGMWQKKSYQIKICLTGSWIIMSGHHDEWQRFLDMFLYNIFLQSCNARKVRFSISKLIKQGQATFSLLLLRW